MLTGVPNCGGGPRRWSAQLAASGTPWWRVNTMWLPTHQTLKEPPLLAWPFLLPEWLWSQGQVRPQGPSFCHGDGRTRDEATSAVAI